MFVLCSQHNKPIQFSVDPKEEITILLPYPSHTTEYDLSVFFFISKCFPLNFGPHDMREDFQRQPATSSNHRK